MSHTVEFVQYCNKLQDELKTTRMQVMDLSEQVDILRQRLVRKDMLVRSLVCALSHVGND